MQLPSTELVSFTELSTQDVPFIHKLRCYPEVAQFNTIGIPKSEENTKENIAEFLSSHDQTHQVWIIHLKDQGPIGELGIKFKPARYKGAEFHYSLLPSFWNKGIATHCVKHLIKWAFVELKMHRLEAGVAINNFGSIKVLEKAGLKKEGQHRQILPLASGWSDNYTYAILGTD